MLVSDYDGTYYLNDKDIYKNIELTSVFRKKNLFVIATGRSYYDFNKKEKLYNINYDYLVINHGATIIKCNKIIYNITIDNSLKNNIIKILNKKTIINSFACSMLESRLTLNNTNITKIHVMYKTIEDVKYILNLLSNYNDEINYYTVCNDRAIEIVSKKADKYNAIKYISCIEKLDNNEIYTIGNGLSDLEMVKAFKGFCMKNSKQELKNICNNKYDSVSNLIEDILSNKV